jgi:hypothetical protein
MAFKNKVLMKKCGPKGEEEEQHKEENYADIKKRFLICGPTPMIKLRRMRWAGKVERMGKRNAYRIFVGKPERKRLLGRPRRRWGDNINMDLRETGWGGMDWIELAQNRDHGRALVNKVMNLRVP